MPEFGKGRGKNLNPINLLPVHIRVEIERIIDLGASRKDILHLIDERYKDGDLQVRSLYTIGRYVKEYKARRGKQPKDNSTDNADSGSGSGAGSGSEIELPTLTPEEIFGAKNLNLKDKKGALEYLGNWCNNRAGKLHNLGSLDSKGEATLVKYISEMREVIETLSKLSGEISQNDDKQIVVNLIHDNMFQIMSIVARSAREAYGEDRLIIFKEILKRNFASYRSDIDISTILEDKKVGSGSGQGSGTGNSSVIEVKKIEETTVEGGNYEKQQGTGIGGSTSESKKEEGSEAKPKPKPEDEKDSTIGTTEPEPKPK